LIQTFRPEARRNACGGNSNPLLGAEDCFLGSFKKGNVSGKRVSPACQTGLDMAINARFPSMEWLAYIKEAHVEMEVLG